MFRLDNYMEEWAVRYKGMLHTPEEPRFFRCNSEYTVDQFLQNYQDITHPVCAIVTHLEGTRDVSRNLDRPKYICLFLAYADPDDYKAQADAKEINKNNADAFLAKLYYDSQLAARQNRRNPLSMVDLTNVRYDTIGPITSKGWFELAITIESLEFTKVCYSPTDYIE